MRSLHLPVTHLPWTTGGKEVYCHGLCRELRALGHDAQVVIHQNPGASEPTGEHRHEGVPVRVLPPIPGPAPRSAVYGCEPDAVPGFEDLLNALKPDVVHLHDFSVGANLLHLRAARHAGARIVLTYHSPGQFCTQRSLLFRGRTVCDGRIDAVRCTECRLGVLGVPAAIGRLLARVPQDRLDPDAESAPLRALTARAATDRFIGAWQECLATVDRIHVNADWARDMLNLNAVPAGRVVLIRTGTSAGPVQEAPALRPADGVLRLAFVGRCDPVKGVHVLVDAVQRLNRDAPVRVAFFGPYWKTAYGERLRREIEGDPRFELPRQVAPQEIVGALREFDACVVPSIWLEIGPLVVLEAFAAGIPVIGSRLGGIAELVRDGVDGCLHAQGDAGALAQIIGELLDAHPARVTALAENVIPPRTMAKVAAEMADLYRSLTGIATLPQGEARTGAR